MNNETIEILFEDKDVLVINKPAGLVVHPDGHTAERTLCDWVLEHYPYMKGVGEPLEVSNELRVMNYGGEKNEGKEGTDVSSHNSEFIIHNSIPRPGIVHRLDRGTSGVLVLAKNQDSFMFLKKQFQDRTIEKNYRAFVYGVFKDGSGVIDRPIARSKNDFRKWTAERGKRGEERQAITEYSVLAQSGQFSLLDVFPKTGRTHQIRVHLKAVSHPIVCDKLYASGKECALGFKRTALHAFSIKFMLPLGKEIKVEAPYPEDFKVALRFFTNNS